MNYSEQILKARFEQLPEDIKEAIMATPWKEKLRQISEKHNLHIDQAGHLGEETVLVMFGIEHADNLITNIAKHAEVSEEKAEMIAEDLNREIFLKVRESLKKIFEEKEEKESSFLGGSLSADEAGFLGKKSEEEKRGSFLATSLLGKTGEKTEEGELDREEILREIEDKEHHNLPSINKSELHLEIPFPNEIASNEYAGFQKQNPANEIKREKPAEIFNTEEQKQTQTQKQPSALKEEALRTMPKDIVKAKMEGTVSVPKEMVEVGDAVLSQAKKSTQTVDNKVDPYREQLR